MDRLLAILDHREESLALIEEMAELADGVGAEVFVLSLLTKDEFEEQAEVTGAVRSVEGSQGGVMSGSDAAKSIGERTLAENIPGVEVDRVIGEVADDDDRVDIVLERADDHDVDHIALVGRRRSPTGKAIFGDVAQGVILNFDGYVTITMA